MAGGGIYTAHVSYPVAMQSDVRNEIRAAVQQGRALRPVSPYTGVRTQNPMGAPIDPSRVNDLARALGTPIGGDLTSRTEVPNTAEQAIAQRTHESRPGMTTTVWLVIGGLAIVGLGAFVLSR